jgi:hypothetical protein
MAKNQYTISLNSGYRKALRRIISSDDAPAFKVKNARILLNTDSGKGGGKRSDRAIAKEFKVSVNAIERIQKRFLERGLEIAVNQRLSNKDTDLVVSVAPDTGTFVDFGTGQVTVKSQPDGSVNVTLNGGVNGKGVLFTNSANGVNIFSGSSDFSFPGGSVTYDPIKGLVVNYPGGGVTYDSTNGLVVKYPGGGATYNSATGGVVQFPGGEVNFGLNGETTNLSLANNAFG